jgi:hypothetical protein
MKHIKNFEEYKTENINEKVKLFGKEVKLWPSYNEILRKKLFFLNSYDLDKYSVGVNQKEIKDLMIRIDKETKTTRSSIKKEIETADVTAVDSMFKAIKALKIDLNDENKLIGYISYYSDLGKFVYNKGFEFNR